MTVAASTEDARVPSGRTLRRLGVELLLGAIVAAVVSLGLQWLVGRFWTPYPSNVPIAWMTLGCAALLAVGLWLAAARRWPGWATPLSWAGLSALATLPIALLLKGTRYYLGGVEIDQSFRAPYLTRLTESAALADMNYTDVPPYYPAGWFWLGGRFANALGLEGWQAFKPWSMVTLAVSGVLCFALWSVLVRRQVAVVLAMLTTIVGVLHGAGEPYSWVIVATIPPLAVLAWRMLCSLRTGERPIGAAVVLGLALGAFGATYTLLAGFFALLLVLLAVANVVVTQGERILVARRTLVPAAVVAALGIAVALLVWAPYLVAVISGRPTHNAAARFLPEASIYLPTPMLEFSVTGALCLAGVVWIVVAARRSVIAVGLGAVAATCYLWYALSTLALVADTTLLAFRTQVLLIVVLACAGVLGIAKLARFGVRRLPALPVRTLGLLLAFGVLLSLVQQAPSLHEDGVKAAFTDAYPTGGNGANASSKDDPDQYVSQVDSEIRRLTGKRPDELVLLSNSSVLLTAFPYWTYLSGISQYGNPMADFNAREAAVNRWATATTPDRLAAEMDRSPGTRPTVLVLLRDPGGETAFISLIRDAFPADPNGRMYPVTFPMSAFAGPPFTRSDVGPFTVVVRR